MQFHLQPPPPPPKSPQWWRDFVDWLSDVLRPMARFFGRVSEWMPDLPVARVLLWTLIVAGVALALWMIWTRVREGEWRLPKRHRALATAVEPEPEWTPDAAASRAWLQEADALAAQGRFAEAVHHLLFRSVEDIARRRPQLNRPALTSRELAAADALPARARQLFSGIAGQVERSLFGGRPVGADDWRAARAAYSDFALPQAWRVA